LVGCSTLLVEFLVRIQLIWLDQSINFCSTFSWIIRLWLFLVGSVVGFLLRGSDHFLDRIQPKNIHCVDYNKSLPTQGYMTLRWPVSHECSVGHRRLLYHNHASVQFSQIIFKPEYSKAVGIIRFNNISDPPQKKSLLCSDLFLVAKFYWGPSENGDNKNFWKLKLKVYCFLLYSLTYNA
jgi:hypothetical protein